MPPEITYPRIILEELRELRKENSREHEAIRSDHSATMQRVAVCETGIDAIKSTIDKHSQQLAIVKNGASTMHGQWMATWKILALILGSIAIGALGWMAKTIYTGAGG